MRNYINIACTPYDEDCVQVTRTGDYLDAMREECDRFAQLLREIFPWAEDQGITFRRKGFEHDFGVYYEVVAYYNDESEFEANLAVFIQDNYPATWEDSKVRPMPELELSEEK